MDGLQLNLESTLADQDNAPTLYRPEATENKFKIEINLGLALPFRYHASKAQGATQSAVVQTVDQNNNLIMTKVETCHEADARPLTGTDYDVLTVLSTMAWEQRDNKANQKGENNGFRVYFTISEICRRLGLSK
ncbi:MAG: hypothetical protein HOM21_10535, partial [Halobacteriovoraceae bacterium]|nr:hypothetical protein [Halobacteriovoraceae bacterium]